VLCGNEFRADLPKHRRHHPVRCRWLVKERHSLAVLLTASGPYRSFLRRSQCSAADRPGLATRDQCTNSLRGRVAWGDVA
jgi:hypothetical protein